MANKRNELGWSSYEWFENSLVATNADIARLKKANADDIKANRLDDLLQALDLLKRTINNIHLATEIVVLTADRLPVRDGGMETLKAAIVQRKAGFEVRTDWEAQVDELKHQVYLMKEARK